MTAVDRAEILARRAKVTASIAKRQRAAGQHDLAKATTHANLAARTALAAIVAITPKADPAPVTSWAPEAMPETMAEVVSWPDAWLTAEDARYWARQDAA